MRGRRSSLASRGRTDSIVRSSGLREPLASTARGRFYPPENPGTQLVSSRFSDNTIRPMVPVSDQCDLTPCTMPPCACPSTDGCPTGSGRSSSKPAARPSASAPLEIPPPAPDPQRLDPQPQAPQTLTSAARGSRAVPRLAARHPIARQHAQNRANRRLVLRV